jgi:hypothetical protein
MVFDLLNHQSVKAVRICCISPQSRWRASWSRVDVELCLGFHDGSWVVPTQKCWTRGTKSTNRDYLNWFKCHSLLCHMPP